MFKFLKGKTKFQIFRFLCFIAYLGCIFVLVFEASLNGKLSANQSNAVGGTIANTFNDLSGDQTVAVLPEEIVVSNKISEANVGDSYQLQTQTLPENSTYKSVVYSSSNESVATVSSSGLIEFLSAGEATITASNQHFSSVIDSFTVTVSNVEVSDITLSVNAQQENGVYILDLDVNNYAISATVLPENATDQTVTYSTDTTAYMSVNSYGVLTPKKHSNGEVTTVVVSSGSIQKELKFIVKVNEIALTSLSVSNPVSEVYVSQTYTPTVSFTPSDATYKDYTVTSSNTSVLSISGKGVKGVSAGTATVTVTSTKYQNVSASFEITVLPQPEVTDFSARLSSQVVIGTTNKISISNVTPKYANQSTMKYRSLNEEVATVNASGSVKAVGLGTATIEIYSSVNSFSVKTLTVTVIERVVEEDHTTDFSVTYLQGERPVIFTNSPINLQEYFIVENFQFTEGYPTTNKAITYSLSGENSQNGTISGSTLTASAAGAIEVTITHTASRISKTVSLFVLNDFDIEFVQRTESFVVFEEKTFVISSQQDELQNYFVSVNSPSVSIKNIDGAYHISSAEAGEFTICVTPVYDGEEYSQMSKSYNISVAHNFATSIIYTANNEQENLEIVLDGSPLNIYVNDSFVIHPTVDAATTITNFEYLSSDEEVLTVEGGKINVVGIGEATVTVTESYSGIQTQIQIIINNKIIINENNAFTLKANNVNFDSESNTYSLTNGFSGKITVNFDSQSTFNTVVYSTSDDEIISIGQDGTLTPHKEGTATLTLVIDDGMQDEIILEVTVKVERQPLIQNLSEFFYLVRKGLGHFGAFAVLGIFSTLTYMLYLDKAKWLFSIPVNFISGFYIAILTELIQRFVPGRSGVWNDVTIDFSGFVIGSIITAIIIFICYFVSFSKRKLHENKIKKERDRVASEKLEQERKEQKIKDYLEQERLAEEERNKIKQSSVVKIKMAEKDNDSKN
ncbi:MAG: hypothetical protein E7370_02325 [Clostridiales bacterium]|nr:hypothetical protein [Clostridiales bacterium]